MFRRFDRYLVGAFLSRTLLVLAGLTGILTAFDVMASSDEILTGEGVFFPLAHYAWLRLPQILLLVLPLSALIGAMMAMGQLASRQELIAAMAGGVPAARMGVVLLCGGFLLGGIEALILDRWQPGSAAALRLWADADYAGAPPAAQSTRLPSWFSAGDILLHADHTGIGASVLTDVTVIKRDPKGMIAEYLQAPEAIYHDGVVTLRNLRRIGLTAGGSGTTDERLATLELPLRIRPSELAKLGETVDELRLSELASLSRRTSARERIDDFYETSLQRRLAQPASIPVMALLALPLAFELPRRGRMARMQASVLTGGFLYLVIERLLLAFGEDGALPPVLAAWLPAVLSLACVALVVHTRQSPRPRRSGAVTA